MKKIEKLLIAAEISQAIAILLILIAIIVQVIGEQLIVCCVLSVIVLLLTLFLIFLDIIIKNGFGIMVHLPWLFMGGFILADSIVEIMS